MPQTTFSAVSPQPAPCRSNRATANRATFAAAFLIASALMSSVHAADEPAAAPASARPIKSLRRLDDTIKRFGDDGDNFHMSWADNDKVYVSYCDGVGPRLPQPAPLKPDEEYNSRLFAIDGEMPNVRFEYLPGYPDLLNIRKGPVNRYYNFGTLARDGRIYQFLSTPNHIFQEKGARFVGAKLIYSPDDGRTWRNQDGSSPVRWETWGDRTRENMIFFEEPDDAFSLITVLQMGRNYSLNKDGYVYLYSPNGSVEGKMNQLVLCRVPQERLLDRAAYEFFAGTSADGAPRFSSRIEDREPIHTFPPGWVNRRYHPYAWHPSVIYFAPSQQYLMVNWGIGTDDSGMWFRKPSYFGFWTAPAPWGPWAQVHEEQAWTPEGEEWARCYQPQIAPKWIAADGTRFWLIWTDYQDRDRPHKYYQFNAQQVAVEFETP